MAACCHSEAACVPIARAASRLLKLSIMWSNNFSCFIFGLYIFKKLSGIFPGDISSGASSRSDELTLLPYSLSNRYSVEANRLMKSWNSHDAWYTVAHKDEFDYKKKNSKVSRFSVLYIGILLTYGTRVDTET